MLITEVARLKLTVELGTENIPFLLIFFEKWVNTKIQDASSTFQWVENQVGQKELGYFFS